MNRRQLIKAGVALGIAGAAVPVARYCVLPPPATGLQRSREDLARFICAGLDEDAKAHACLPYDHPLRQFHNRGLWVGGVTVHAGTLGWQQRRALTDLVDLTLSAAGRERMLSQLPQNLSGVNFLKLLAFGTPGQGPWQMTVSGIHMNLRLGGHDANGIAFGGPQVYGDQRGNERAGLPGNRFRHQMQAAHRLNAALTPAQRQAVRVVQAPPQTRIDLQGAAGRFDGVAVADMPAHARQLATSLVASQLDTYSEADAAFCWQCLQHNGGVDALRFADYEVDFQGGRRAGDAPSQIFRLEGPAAVLYFRGEPHLHAFINIAMDGEHPLSVGEPVGRNPAVLQDEPLRRFFERAMQAETGADAAYFPGHAVVGRLPAGELHTGDLWTAESWVNELVVCEVSGGDLSPQATEALRGRGVTPQSSSRYRIAACAHYARDDLGKIQSTTSHGLLRDALVRHARLRGFQTSA
jgi:hypothetical protein